MIKTWFLGFFVLIASIAGLHAQVPVAEQEEATAADGQGPAMFQFHGVDLFELAQISNFPAEKRVKRLSQRMKRYANSPLIDSREISVYDDENLRVSTITVDSGDIIMGVWEADAALHNLPRQQLAQEWAKQIKDAIDQHRKDYTMENYAKAALLAAVATVVFLILWRLVHLLFRRELRYVEAKFKGKEMLKFLDGDSVVMMNENLMKVLRSGLVLAIFIIYIDVVLSFFPWTYNMSARLFELISKPFVHFGEAFVTNIPNFFALAVIGLILHLILKSTKHVFDQIAEGKVKIKGFYQDWAETTYSLLRILFVVFALVAAFPYIPGSGSPAFKGISIFMGVLVSLGSSSAVGNIFGGLMLTYMRSFQPGDFVKINGMKGTVLGRRTFSTRLKTPTNEIISIPNVAVSSNHIINYSRMTKTMGVNIGAEVTIGYDVPWRTVHELLLKSAEGVPDVLEEPAPTILQLGLGDFYVKYKLVISTKHPERKFRILSNLHQNIQDNFAKANVEIMSPHYQANREGEAITIPETRWADS
ncbi:mechanosensitive ion channel family protein [Coraliomargarita akajimensis]|uniref:MscS Mechanosensitive ion channel n=1 Tax=Coraliomargarita akajimensis (strain DSM 45221 / IAM 15411 / JCM 23193 / KCTC 12865 / 04OKA010-24) TaxID=583355 RepID=D5ERF7_CORAD|nr:mechanosensitive ion channel domain-containing protein [Coraliomargarita akajimensis]ADE56001.1 MscS Mechanosensitive ion channel [Coraliomargarita akajimensis DSM 45221]